VNALREASPEPGRREYALKDVCSHRCVVSGRGLRVSAGVCSQVPLLGGVGQLCLFVSFSFFLFF